MGDMSVVGVMPIVPVVMGFGRRPGKSEGRDRSQRSGGKSSNAPELRLNRTPRHKHAPLLRPQPPKELRNSHTGRGYGGAVTAGLTKSNVMERKPADMGLEPPGLARPTAATVLNSQLRISLQIYDFRIESTSIG